MATVPPVLPQWMLVTSRVIRKRAAPDGPDPLDSKGIEAIVPAGQQRGLGPPRGDFRPVWLAVDEHVVGLVRDVDDRRGLRVTRSGRGDAADRVEAEHLDNVRQ